MIPLPGYTYLGPLGTPGHFGVVFHARNDLTGRDVAIKHIDAPMTADALAAWEAEAHAMAACAHENIVAILHADHAAWSGAGDGVPAGRQRRGAVWR